VRLLTLNIWNYTPPWPARRSLIVETILAHDPDVVALQETRHDFRFERGRSQGQQIADLTGRQLIEATAQVYWPWPRVDEGLTILTTTPPEETAVVRLRRLSGEKADENRRILLAASIRCAGRLVWIGNTHFSLSSAARQANAGEIVHFAHEHPGPLAIMGDLNAEPNSCALQVLQNEGLVDVWDAVGAGNGFTYASSQPVRRIDYILLRDLVAQRMLLVGNEDMDGVYPSDHCGILADVTFPGDSLS